jgi:hypothetical protein
MWPLLFVLSMEALNAFFKLVEARGLRTNINKCHFTPERCSQDDIDTIEHPFPCQLTQFPCKYLGIPLSVHKVRKVDLQSLIDAVADCLPTWKAGLMARWSHYSRQSGALCDPHPCLHCGGNCPYSVQGHWQD